MPIYFNEKYRIKRNAKYEDQMRYLQRELKLFSDYASILTVSAIIGFNNKLFVPIDTPAADGVQTQFFNPRCRDIMDLIAYAHEKKQSILSEDGKYTIFESYANGGFQLLINKLGIDFDVPTNNDRETILEKYFKMLLLNEFVLENGTNN